MGFTMPMVQKIILAAFPYLFTFLAFILIYIIVPNCKVQIRYAATGAFVATIFFEIAKYGFAVYVTNFPFYKLMYGAFSIIPIFLIWLYVSWQIILFGAVICHDLAQRQQHNHV
jgi:membrane protein